MARQGRIERRIRRCYYWTSLSMEECIDRHLPRTSGGSNASQRQAVAKSIKTDSVDKLALTRLLSFFLFLGAIGFVAWLVTKIPEHIENS